MWRNNITWISKYLNYQRNTGHQDSSRIIGTLNFLVNNDISKSSKILEHLNYSKILVYLKLSKKHWTSKLFNKYWNI